MNDNQNSMPPVMPESAPIEMNKRPRLVPFFLLGLAAIIVLGLVGAGVVYHMNVQKLSDAPWVIKTATILGTPVAKVNGKAIHYSEYVDDKKTIENFYKQTNQEAMPFSSDEISDQIITRLVANILIAEAAAEYKITVTDETVANARKELISSGNSDEAAVSAEIQKLYGWSIDEYVEKVVRPMLLEQKVNAYITANTSTENMAFAKEQVRASHILIKVEDPKKDTEAKRQAERIIGEIKAGKDFADLARQHNTDATKETGGDLNWFERGMTVPAFEEPTFKLAVGEYTTTPIKTEFGYHIVKVTDKRTVPDFRSFMEKRLKEAEIKFILPIHNPFDALLNPSAQEMMEATTGTMQ